VEFPCCTLPQNGFVDITDNTITYTADEAANFAGGIIFDFSGAPTITDVTLDPLSNSDFLSTGITFTDTSVTFDVTGVTTAAANESLILDVQTAAVPEPFTLSLFGAGLAGAAAMRRRKKAQKA
jgi:hypothetical protein